EAAPTPMQAVLAELEPGREYKGAIAIVGEVNERLEVRLGLNGTIQAAPSEPDGLTTLHLKLRKAELVIGDATWVGSGEIDLLVHPLGDIRITRSTMPAGLMSAMAALQKMTGNFLRGAVSDQPVEDLGRVLQEELGMPQPKATF